MSLQLTLIVISLSVISTNWTNGGFTDPGTDTFPHPIVDLALSVRPTP